MKYLIICFLAIISCKENKKIETKKTTIKQELVEPKVRFYELFLEYEAKQELSNKFTLDTSKYFKTYVLQGESKLIFRQFEDIKPSDILSEKEFDNLWPRNIFENYQSDFIRMHKFNDKKYNTNKTEIAYLFTYPYSVAKNKVLIGLQVRHIFHSRNRNKIMSMRFFVFEKIKNEWQLIGEGDLLNPAPQSLPTLRNNNK